MITELLTKLEEEKDQWIYDSIARFNEGFLRFDGQKYDKNQVLAGVYGTTQEEKTAFILTMHGIGDDLIPPLSQALRGKQENSIMTTSFIYKKSLDENFYLFLPDKTTICCENLLELESAVEKVLQGEKTYNKPIILHIAKQFFTNKQYANRSESLSLIDFPSGDPKEKRKEAYFEQILTSYLPLCRVTFIIECFSTMDRRFQFDRPKMRNWLLDCENDRLVLTRCLQSPSVKNAIESGKIASSEDYRAYFREQLNRNHRTATNQIYPLELELKPNNSLLSQKAKGWTHTLFLELLEEVTVVAALEDQILQLKNRQHHIRKEMVVELERMKNEIMLIEESIEEKYYRCEQFRKAAQFLQREIGFYENKIYELHKIQLPKFKVDLDQYFIVDQGGQIAPKERKTSVLKGVYQLAEVEMLEFYKKQIKTCTAGLQQIVQNVLASVQFDFQLNPILDSLELKHGRGLDQYLIMRNFEEDYMQVSVTLENNSEIICDFYTNQLYRFKRNIEQKLNHLKKQREIYVQLVNEQMVKQIELMFQKEETVADIQAKLEEANRKWVRELKQPHKIDEYLKEEFVKAVSKWQEKMWAEDTADVERWAYHNYCQLILRQVERIIGNGGDF